jgi:hypothetical protein
VTYFLINRLSIIHIELIGVSLTTGNQPKGIPDFPKNFQKESPLEIGNDLIRHHHY